MTTIKRNLALKKRNCAAALLGSAVVTCACADAALVTLDINESVGDSFNLVTETSIGFWASATANISNAAGGPRSFQTAFADIGSSYYQNGDTAGFDGLSAGTLVYAESGDPPTPQNGASFGEVNWLAIDTTTSSDERRRGWLSFTLDGEGFVTSVDQFIYESDSNSSAPTLSAAQAAAIPEFSSGHVVAFVWVLAGLLHRRRA